MQENTLSDEKKQELLFRQIGIQVKLLFIIILNIILIISPFLLFISMDHLFLNIGYELFYSVNGLILSIAVVFVYLIIRSAYVRIYRSRKISS